MLRKVDSRRRHWVFEVFANSYDGPRVFLPVHVIVVYLNALYYERVFQWHREFERGVKYRSFKIVFDRDKLTSNEVYLLKSLGRIGYSEATSYDGVVELKLYGERGTALNMLEDLATWRWLLMGNSPLTRLWERAGILYELHGSYVHKDMAKLVIDAVETAKAPHLMYSVFIDKSTGDTHYTELLVRATTRHRYNTYRDKTVYYTIDAVTGQITVHGYTLKEALELKDVYVPKATYTYVKRNKILTILERVE